MNRNLLSLVLVLNLVIWTGTNVQAGSLYSDFKQSFRPKPVPESKQEAFWKVIGDMDTPKEDQPLSTSTSQVVDDLAATSPAVDENDEKVADAEIPLTSCWDDKLGIKFLCNKDWGFNEREDDLFMVVEAEPLITVTLARVQESVKFVNQLDRDKLDALGLYKEGFVIEQTKVAGLNAIKVRGFSQQSANVRLLDYYLVRDGVLYGLMFSVSPKEQWDNYKPLFDKLVSSFDFLNDENPSIATKVERHNMLEAIYGR